MHIDINYDLQKFGNIMLKIRNNGGLTQKYIKEKTGLNAETIRRIEYGQQLPSIDTLSKLSELYNINTIKILEECQLGKNEFLINIENTLDKITYSDDLEKIDEVVADLQHFLIEATDSYPDYIIKKITQLELLAKTTKLKNKTDITHVAEAIQLCNKTLLITHENFNINKIEDYYFNLIELRILITLSFMYTRQRKIKLALYIINHTIKCLKHHVKSNSESITILLQAYFIKSYEYYMIKEHSKVILVCDEGLIISREYHNTKHMPSLLFRKGISEYLLNIPSYRDTLTKCIILLDLIGEDKIKLNYLKTLKDKYSIIL